MSAHLFGLPSRSSRVDLAVLDPDELQIVGQKDVVRQRLVATDLIGLENLIEVFANGLVLDIAEVSPPSSL
jgi:hypothetical protein